MSSVTTFIRLLTPKEAAEFLSVGEKTLAKWRSERRGPSFVKQGRIVRYRISDLDEWICTHIHEAGA